MRLTFPLRTERLDLRPLGPGDLDDVHAYRSRPDVVSYLLWDVQSREQVAEKLAEDATIVDFHTGKGLKLAVVERESGRVIGDVCLFGFDPDFRHAETGYIMNPEFAGKGYATEAAREMLRIGFEIYDLHRIYARCDEDNTASWRLMERIGMRREATFVRNEILWYSKHREDPWTTELVYAMLEDEWREKHRA
ncbi:GNAT family N-acetyltransferase [Phytomonospora sp. NPDC050363]|uniref:GNAT family N-acetyltransferase n=1 Tax=Phytomonospora sp. NPDC050363 TaxID=3155642 RepID=UPI0033D33620